MELAEAVCQALAQIPCSERALALRAGVSPATLTRIKSGERGVSPEIVRRLAQALAMWAEDCAGAEHTLREALERSRDIKMKIESMDQALDTIHDIAIAAMLNEGLPKPVDEALALIASIARYKYDVSSSADMDHLRGEKDQ